MFRTEAEEKENSFSQFFFTRGGLGDNICRLKALHYALERWPQLCGSIFVPDSQVELYKAYLGEFMEVDGLGLGVWPFSEMEKRWHSNLHSIVTECRHMTPTKTHLMIHAFRQVADTEPSEINWVNYPQLNYSKVDISKFKLPQNYVTMGVLFREPTRQFSEGAVQEIIKHYNDKGLTPVILGSEKEKFSGFGDCISYGEKDFKNCLNLINETTVLEAGAVIANSKLFLGVDSGLCHLAGTSDVPIVMGLTNLNPIYRMPIRHEQLGWKCLPVTPNPKELGCSFCQSNFSFMNIKPHDLIDLSSCYYRDNKCTTYMTAEAFTKAGDKLLAL